MNIDLETIGTRLKEVVDEEKRGGGRILDLRRR